MLLEKERSLAVCGKFVLILVKLGWKAWQCMSTFIFSSCPDHPWSRCWGSASSWFASSTSWSWPLQTAVQLWTICRRRSMKPLTRMMPRSVKRYSLPSVQSSWFCKKCTLGVGGDAVFIFLRLNWRGFHVQPLFAHHSSRVLSSATWMAVVHLQWWSFTAEDDVGSCQWLFISMLWPSIEPALCCLTLVTH